MARVLDLPAVLSDQGLRRAFGADVVARARSYAEGDAIRRMPVDDEDTESFEARATVVRGSGFGSYYTQLNVHPYDGFPSSLCTCPVGHQCKHGAALALVVRHDLGGRASGAWQHQLTSVLDELDRLSPDGAATIPLALEVSLLGGRLMLRPMRQGAREKWVKSGAQWRDLGSAAVAGRYDPAGFEALARLGSERATSYYGPSDGPTDVESFGPAVWRLLREIGEVGVTWLCGKGVASVEITDSAVPLTADLRSTASGTEIHLGLLAGDRWWAGEQVRTIGHPAHGAVLTAPAVDRGSAHDVLLTDLARRAGASTIRLLRDGGPIRVGDDDGSFRAEFLPRLQQRFDVVSTDGSVEIPDRPRPMLQCRVTWRSSVRADVAWDWRYGSDQQVCPIDSAAALSGLRDRGAERELVAQVAAESDLTGLTLPDGLPAARRTIEGDGVLVLAEQVLPRLHASELVEVLEEHRPDFRAAEGAPEVSFTADPDAEKDDHTDWLDLEVTIVVDRERVPVSIVLAALSTHQTRVILPSGLHVAADRPEFAALRELLLAAGELREVEGDRIGVGAHDLGLWAQLADLGVVDEQAATWVSRAQALRDLVELPTPDPVGVTSTLRSYQIDGFRWLAFLWQHGLGGILADDMGLGKTLQVLTLISHARAAGAAPFLVVAPTSVVSAWRTEAERHTPDLVIRAVTASAARRGESLAELAEGADVVVTTYTLLRLEVDDYAALTWGGLVMDEAQQAKNHHGKTYYALRQVEAPFRLAVTGTPFENRLLELWALLSLTTPGLYPWPDAFTDNVAKPVEKAGDQAALRRFRQRIRPFVLRRTKELVAADLPPKQEQVLEVQLGAKHRRIYDTHLQRERQKVLGLVEDFEHNRVAIFSALTRMRQLALSPDLVEDTPGELGSAKLDALAEHLKEIVSEGHRVLVFSQFTRFLTMARDRLTAEGIDTTYLDGKTRRRAEVIESFRAGDAPVFLISLKAGGVGLTLTEADYVFVLDPWWNPASEAQAIDRAHRIGQQRPVMVYRLVARDTIEEKVMELKVRKAELFAQVVDGDGGLGEAIGAADIRGLFT